MRRIRAFFLGLGLIIASTIGAGIFSLPYAFLRSGIAVSFGHLLVFGACVATAHIFYYRVVERIAERKRLTGLARQYFKWPGVTLGYIAVIGGLFLSLIAFLILGPTFLRGLFSISSPVATIIFWAACAIPFLVKRVIRFELLGSALVGAIILLFALAAPSAAHPVIAPLIADPFASFGTVLFAIAGWTAVEPLYEQRKKNDIKNAGLPSIFFGGTLVVAALYLLFVFSTYRSASFITEDALSGMMAIPFALRAALIVLGMVALWKTYLHIGYEIQGVLRDDFKLAREAATGAVLIIPVVAALLFSGFFAQIIEFTGGVLISLQYILILGVSLRALPLTRCKRILLLTVTGVFLFALLLELIKLAV